MPIARSILERCQDPYATRRRADRGLPVPCLTGCMAYEPGTERGCMFVNQRVKLAQPKVEAAVSPLRVDRGAPGQVELFPTAEE